MLTLNWNLLWTVVNLIVLTLLLKKFLYSPIMKVMNERKATIENQINEAESKKKDADEKLAKAEDIMNSAMSEAQSEARTIIENAENKKQSIIEDAQKEAVRIAEESKAKTEKERQRLLSDAKEEIINISIEAAKNVAKANISQEEEQRLFDEMLDKVGAANE